MSKLKREFVPEKMVDENLNKVRMKARRCYSNSVVKSKPYLSLQFGFWGILDSHSERKAFSITAALSHHFITKLICELLLHFLDFPSLPVISQCPCHFLVGHFLAVAFLNAPAMSQCFFVLRGELECAFFLIYPPDAILHISASKQIEKKLVQSDFLLTTYMKK